MGSAVSTEKTPLLVLVEGINDERVLKVVLHRGRELGFNPLSEPQVEFRRHSSEVCTSGAQIARNEKHRYSHFLLVWDHDGSALQSQGYQPTKAQGIVQSQLNGYSLKGCSKAIVIAPELEAWFWSDLNAIARTLQVAREELEGYLQELEAKEGLSYAEKPKETLQRVASWKQERADSDLYERITSQANLEMWQHQHPSFEWLVRALRRWFPLRNRGN